MYIREHLLLRGINPDDSSVVLDEQANIATFLLYNLSGQIVGYQQYNPNGPKRTGNAKKLNLKSNELKYFTFLGDEGNCKKLACYGVHTIDNRQHLFIVEGIFDAAKIHNAGHSCLALLSNNQKHFRSFLKALGKIIIAITDNDDAGRKLGNLAHFSFHVPDEFHDLGDMPQKDASELIEKIMNQIYA